ncbi:unnamed protein product [Withania somnifera]
MAHWDYKGGANWTSSVNSIYEDIEPSSGWIEDTKNHYLLIDLPGKFIRFQKSMKAPEKSKCEDSSARLEDGILYIIIPKELPENNERHEAAVSTSDHEENQQKNREEVESNLNGDDTDQRENDKEAGLSDEEEFHDAKMANKWHESHLVAAGKQILWKNKNIVITALIAFSFGVYVSHKCQTNKSD